MILADTSVWIDELHGGSTGLGRLLENGRVSIHPFVIGELACGNLSSRVNTLGSLDALPASLVAEDHEVRSVIERHRLNGLGVGFIDCHLLVSAMLSPDTSLWTRDGRLGAVAGEMDVRYDGRGALH